MDKAIIELKNEKLIKIDSPNETEEENKTNDIEEPQVKGNETNEQDMPNDKRGRGRPKLEYIGKRGRPRKVYAKGKTNEENQEKNGLNSDELGSDEQSDSSRDDTCDESDDFFGFLVEEPETVRDVICSNDREEWERAMLDELDAHERNHTWEIVNKPPDAKVLGCRWVFANKFDEKGNLTKRKARIVAKGCAQRPGVDFNETYSPVASLRSIRIIVALAVKLGLHLQQYDITTAYLNGVLDTTIYMKVPEHFENLVKNSEPVDNKVLKLNKALYGLRQSGKVWYEKLDNYLQSIGFSRMKSEPCIYTYKQNDELLIIAVYVDDIILASKSERGKNFFFEKMSKMFKIRDIGELKYFLGIEFQRSKRQMILTQQKYIKKLLEKFSMEDWKPVKTPMEPNVKITKETCVGNKDDEREGLNKIPYQNLVGALLYLAVTTRPDIAYAVSILSQFNNNFTRFHWGSAKRILRYLKGTISYGLVFNEPLEELKGYADSDWASNSSDRRSYSGYVFKLAGGCMSWEVKKQRTVALSTAEAEYMSLTEATKEAIHLQSLLKEIGYEEKTPVIIFNDNRSAQLMAKNFMINNRNKHIDIRYHFIREAITDRRISTEYLCTESMPADIFTKLLGKQKLEICLNLLNIKNAT